MEIGNIITENLGELFIREQDLIKECKPYLIKHNKSLTTDFYITTADPALFTLKINIYDNN